MAKDGEDWNGLEMMILKSLAHFFKMREQGPSSFVPDLLTLMLWPLPFPLVKSTVLFKNAIKYPRLSDLFVRGMGWTAIPKVSPNWSLLFEKTKYEQQEQCP